MFEMQKNGQKFNTIMQWQTGHTHLCPIIQWAALTQQILGYPGTTKNTKVLTVQNSRKLLHITSKIITMALHDGVAAYGKAKLQIFKHKVGTHFIQLRHSHGNVPWGGTRIHNHANPWWLSNAFMKYIRKQIKKITFDVSQKMLTMQQFRHTPTNATNGSKDEYGGCANLMLSNWK
jgi:hypothetical protein